MSKKVIDVSSYQGVVNWYKVKASGIEGAILKVIRKDLNPDKQFENNWKGCENAGVPIIGVYNYSYATTLDKARADAKKVLSILAGRRAKVWLDVEDTCQKGLGITLIRIIQAYQEIIEKAGLEFGVYTGLSFYNSYIKPWAGYLTCRFWIARYRNPVTANQPVIKHTLEGWQFSSEERVPGITGNVDMNLWYGEIMSMPEVPQKNPYSSPDKILKLKLIRMRGHGVGWVQYHLVRLGFLPARNKKGKSNIDEVYGPDTAEAVAKAQAHYGIEVDSIVGAMTVYVLRYN
ncbi:autolytic lysozyme [Lachnospiraceae bacterium]|jgi:GH25 family lysozyme M1 (1,4-beta-N-acetylmuramidase)|nr:autolytic lysozyme [Lachnospiraceae bacterium]